MKKAVAIIIFLIYLISIASVSLLGIQAVVYKPTVYATAIHCTNSQYNPETGRILLKYSVGLEFQLTWEILPEETTYKDVTFPYPAEGNYEISNTGHLTIYKKNSFKIKILVADGSNVSVTVNFVLY